LQISFDLRGPEGPLFHSNADAYNFFHGLYGDALIRIVQNATLGGAACIPYLFSDTLVSPYA